MTQPQPYQAWGVSATPDIFGPILGPRDVRRALQATLANWADTYIAEMAQRTDTPMVAVGEWDAVWEDRALPADLTPAVWATCWSTDPKMTPRRNGDGTWRAFYIAQANIALYGEDWAAAADLMGLYLAALRSCVLQNRDLGGFATDTMWLGEAVHEMERQTRRTVEVGVAQFRVTVDDVVDDNLGPRSPGTPPGTGGNPTVDQVNVTLDEYPPGDLP